MGASLAAARISHLEAIMRPDFGKVITERPRAGGNGHHDRKGYKKRLQKDGLDAVQRESIKERSGGTKEFTDVLGPIKGFLRKATGRKWDDVYSEISKVLPASGGMSYTHARGHLFDYVELKTQVIDGDIYDMRGHKVYRDWYVDDDGILREMPRESYKYKQRPPKVFTKTEKGEWLIFDRQHTHVWYACEMRPYESSGTAFEEVGYKRKTKRAYKTYPMVYDVFLKCSVWGGNGWSSRHLLGDNYGASVYCVSKRQISSNEIKRYKLTPAPQMLAA